MVIEYDTRRYPFQRVLAYEAFGNARLDQLHAAWKRRTHREELNYNDNLRLRRRMQQLPDDSVFYKLYHAWVAKVVAPKYGNRISYSAHPKMRVHLARTGGVSEFHCDADITSRPDQINCYLPFTDVHGTATIWIENQYGARDYEPANLTYGQALLWDGGRLEHGSFPNETDSTRVSCDFRFHALNPARVASPWRDVLAGRPPELASGTQERSVPNTYLWAYYNKAEGPRAAGLLPCWLVGCLLR